MRALKTSTSFPRSRSWAPASRASTSFPVEIKAQGAGIQDLGWFPEVIKVGIRLEHAQKKNNESGEIQIQSVGECDRCFKRGVAVTRPATHSRVAWCGARVAALDSYDDDDG